MARERYDFVLGLGPACSCSQSLRAAGLQLASMPFDWNGLQLIPDRLRLLETDFADWLKPEDFEAVGEDVLGRKNVWVNRRTRCTFAHDFKEGTITAAEAGAVEVKYRRRIDRMYRLIASSRRILLVWVQIDTFPRPPDDDFQALRKFFLAKWPGLACDVLAFDWLPDVPEAEAKIDVSEGLCRVGFDYRDRGQERWFADYDRLADWLKCRYSVRDYRIREEKRAWRQLERKKKFARFGVQSWPAYFIARSTYALKKHFAKRKGKV